MRWLPFSRVSMDSHYSVSELLAALERITRPEPEQWHLLPPEETAMFVGRVSRDRLEFRRAIRGRNSFAPYVVGRVVESAAGARIDAVLRPHPVVLAFMLGWLAFMTPWAIVAIRQLSIEGLSLQPVIALAMWLGVYPMCMLCFLPEERRMLSLLRQLAGTSATPAWPD